LLHFDQLGLALKVIEQEHAGVFWEAETGSDLGKVGPFGFAISVSFLIEGGGLGDGGGEAVFLILFGGRPIDQRGGKFFPFIAFGALVAYAVPFDFILGDQLVGAVFEDEAAGEILGRGVESKSKTEQGQRDRGEQQGAT
jgi:hypothetical protein